jgi:hypothetical protein
MRSISLGRYRATPLVIALAAAVSTGSAQSRVALPAGTVVIVRTTTALQSATAKAGDTFETTVDENVGIDEYTVIPAGSRIRGVVAVATPATRQQSGVIDVVFDRLTLADGSTVEINGKLTSTDSAERTQIKANPSARVVLVGARGGVGAAIAGAGSGKSANNILSALGAMLSEGRDVALAAGTPLAVELESALSLRTGRRVRSGDASTIYTAPDRVSAAQTSLARLNYYRGPINGRLDDATRRALFQFQIDRRLTGTGNLDGRTAQALGINVGGAGAVAGAVLSVDAASTVRRDAQALVARDRSELGASSVGELNPTRAYAQTDIDLWFALSAFADNASVYEQVVRNGGNRDAVVLAGRALVGAARRVDAAMPNARTSAQLQNAWTAVRRQLTTIDTAPPGG